MTWWKSMSLHVPGKITTPNRMQPPLSRVTRVHASFERSGTFPILLCRPPRDKEKAAISGREDRNHPAVARHRDHAAPAPGAGAHPPAEQSAARREPDGRAGGESRPAGPPRAADSRPPAGGRPP